MGIPGLCIVLRDIGDCFITFTCINETIVTGPCLVTSIEDETQLQYGSKNAGGFGGKGGAPMDGQAPNGQEGEAKDEGGSGGENGVGKEPKDGFSHEED